jgi:predicted transcriptional regulator
MATRNRVERFTVLLTPEELRLLQELAERQQETMSVVVRQAVKAVASAKMNEDNASSLAARVALALNA